MWLDELEIAGRPARCGDASSWTRAGTGGRGLHPATTVEQHGRTEAQQRRGASDRAQVDLRDNTTVIVPVIIIVVIGPIIVVIVIVIIACSNGRAGESDQPDRESKAGPAGPEASHRCFLP